MLLTNEPIKSWILVTGAAGFIGTHFIEEYLKTLNPSSGIGLLLIDILKSPLSYENLEPIIESHPFVLFKKMDITCEKDIQTLFEEFKISGVINFAAETHVDLSIKNPALFFKTNLMGTLNLLSFSLKAFYKEPTFKFLQVSTDEVYGSLTHNTISSKEDSKLNPSNPYSASKAAADQLCLSFWQTYKLPVLITRSSNNYGPYQFPDKFIPRMIHKAISNQSLPIYGNGENIRDWIHALDHVRGVWAAYSVGKPGSIYHFSGQEEHQNLFIAKLILKEMALSEELIEFVSDRPGHDLRYSLDSSLTSQKLSWKPQTSFQSGLKETILWYKKHQDWARRMGSDLE